MLRVFEIIFVTINGNIVINVLWHLNKNSIFIAENCFETVACKTPAILW